MKDNDITDILDLTFTVNEEVFGQVSGPSQGWGVGGFGGIYVVLVEAAVKWKKTESDSVTVTSPTVSSGDGARAEVWRLKPAGDREEQEGLHRANGQVEGGERSGAADGGSGPRLLRGTLSGKTRQDVALQKNKKVSELWEEELRRQLYERKSLHSKKKSHNFTKKKTVVKSQYIKKQTT